MNTERISIAAEDVIPLRDSLRIPGLDSITFKIADKVITEDVVVLHLTNGKEIPFYKGQQLAILRGAI